MMSVARHFRRAVISNDYSKVESLLKKRCVHKRNIYGEELYKFDDGSVYESREVFNGREHTYSVTVTENVPAETVT